MTTEQPPRERPYTRKEVVDILTTAVGRIHGDANTGLRQQLSDLAAYVDTLRHELAQLRSIEINATHIPTATDELDAVVVETAAATTTIMDACDRLQSHAAGAPSAISDAINAEVTAIFEACSFQDITGQRITKVIRALKNIEQKTVDILAALGHVGGDMPTQPAPAAPAPAPAADTGLLNGPQLAGKAISQEEIDRLLASFD